MCVTPSVELSLSLYIYIYSGCWNPQGSAVVATRLPVHGSVECSACRKQWHHWASLHAGTNLIFIKKNIICLKGIDFIQIISFSSSQKEKMKSCSLIYLFFVVSLALCPHNTGTSSRLLADAVHLHSWRWKFSGEFMSIKQAYAISAYMCMYPSLLAAQPLFHS